MSENAKGEGFALKMSRNILTAIFSGIAYYICTIGTIPGGFFVGIKNSPGFSNTIINYSGKNKYEGQSLLSNNVKIVLFGIGKGGFIFFKRP